MLTVRCSKDVLRRSNVDFMRTYHEALKHWKQLDLWVKETFLETRVNEDGKTGTAEQQSINASGYAFNGSELHCGVRQK
jgi:hypothetical protein